MAGTAEFQSLARVYASEQVDGMVGSVLGRYRMHTGLSPGQLAAWLGIDLPALGSLSHEAKPRIIGIDRTVRAEHGLAQLADTYRIDPRVLGETFNVGGPDGQHTCERCTR